MRVLFATTHAYLPFRAGGSESSTHDLCLSFLEAGILCAVLAARDERPSAVYQTESPPEVDTVMGYPVFRSEHPVSDLAAAIGHFAPSIIVVMAGRPVTLAAEVARLGLPVLVYLRDAWFDELGGELVVGPRVRYLANSPSTAAAFEARFGLPVSVILPLVRPERYITLCTRTDATFINPVRCKGVEVVLALCRVRPDVLFRFVECWPASDDWRRWLAGQIATLGNVDLVARTDDMRTIYRRTKVLLVPSLWDDSWPRVVHEAQLNGIPVLGSDSGGIPAAVGPGGIIVPRGTPLAEWDRAFRGLWDNDENYARLSVAARTHASREDVRPSYIVQLLRVLLSATCGE